MERDKDKQLKFPLNCEYEVTLVRYEEEMDNFNHLDKVYYINELKDNNGIICDHFIAADGLHNKIKNLNIKIGTNFIIKKKQIDGYANDNPFFQVELPAQKKAVDPAVHESPVGAGFAHKDDKMGLHELTMRVETLEKEVNELKKSALPF